ncbi:MAG: hypothetical protein AAGB04_16210 [Pseudomonadota bacterium]
MGNIVVVTMQEDTTSVHQYIYFFDQHKRITRVIEAWNGGFGYPPRADKYSVANDVGTYRNSYDLDSKKQIVQQVLCKELSKTKLTDPPQMNPIDWETIRVEGAPFFGCK